MTSPDTAFNKARSDEGLIVHLMHPGPEVARRSRQVVGGVLADRPDGFRQVAELLTSELVTNALLHTRLVRLAARADRRGAPGRRGGGPEPSGERGAGARASSRTSTAAGS